MPSPFRLSRPLLSALAASLLAATTAGAQTPLSTGSWTYFNFGGVGSGAGGQPFTFTASSQFFVTVLDAFASGDEFALYDGAALVGTTTTATLGVNCADNVAACLLDDRFARGTFLLDAGSYSFDVSVLASPYGSGGAYIGIDVSDVLAGTPATMSTVPEPATAALTAAGLLAIAGVAARRRRRTA